VKAILLKLAHAYASMMISFVWLASLLLMPFQIGRLLRKVSLPRLSDHPWRTTITVLGVITGVSAVVAVLLVNRSIIHSAQSTVDDVAGRADLQIVASAGSFDEGAVETARNEAGVLAATPILQQTVRLREPSIDTQRVLLLGLDLASNDDTYFRTHQSKEYDEINRDPITFLDSASNIVITRQLADSLGRKLHDKISLQTADGPREFEIWGLLEDSALASAFGGGIAVMHHQAMQAAFNRGLEIDRIDVALAPAADVEEAAARLQQKLGNLHVEVPAQKRGRLARMLIGLETALTSGAAIAVLIAVFLIYNTMLISIVQRKGELGILRSVGTTKKQVVALLTLEGGLLGVVGSFIGAGIGVIVAMIMLHLVTHTVGQVYMNVPSPEVHVDPLLLGACFLFGCVTSVLGALIAALGAASISPLESLRSANMLETKERKGVTAYDVAGVLFLLTIPFVIDLPPVWGLPVAALGACTCLLLGTSALVPRVIQLVHLLGRQLNRRFFGVEAKMANENMTRDLMRTSVTTGALMLGVGMACAFSMFINSFVHSAMGWIENALPGDVIVASALSGIANLAPLSPEVGPEIEKLKLEGVTDLQTIRVADFMYEGADVKVNSVEVVPWGRHSKALMIEGEQDEAIRAMATGTAVCISENFMHRFDKHLGDTITVTTKNGPRELAVAGVYVDYTSDLGVIWMDRATWLANWDDQTVNQYKLHLAPNVDAGKVRDRIGNALGEKYDLMVVTGGEYVANMRKEIDRVFSVMRALQAVALLIAVLGVVNALSANVLDRTREIGVLRAVGMLQRQVKKLIVIEASLMGVIGALLGVAQGLVLGRMMLTHVTTRLVGWTIPLMPDWGTTAQMTISVIVASAIAGFYPARSAATLRVPDAIGYR
jgi:putative ABC transport system permease protein